MGHLADYHQQVSVHTAVRSGMSLSSYGDLHTILHAGRDANLNGLPTTFQAGTTAATARIENDLSFSLTLRAGADGIAHAEEGSGLLAHASLAAAGGAGLDIKLALYLSVITAKQK